MIAFVNGKVVDQSEDTIIVECNQIGYRILVPNGYDFSIGQDVRIHTYTYVKEDAFMLYGFAVKDQLDLFKKLITVNGIGPKGALAILSIMSADDLRFAIFAGDAAAIAKAPGVGKKTAERVILDLKDKIKLDEVSSLPDVVSGQGVAVVDQGARKEAIEALTALGYGATEAAKAVNEVAASDNTSAEEILKQALRFLF